MKSCYHFFLLLAFIAALSACKTPEKWELVWSDEFDEEGAPDPAKWDYESGKKRNKELQVYTRDPKNVRVEDGKLLITALLEEGDSVTSASVHTRDKLDLLYGRVEVSAKVPTGLGTWPAIWMLGKNIRQVGWPECGEIDIMENVGYDPEVIHGNIHTESYNHVIGTNKGNKVTVPKPWEEFHLYAVEWYEDRLDFFVDDSLYFSFEDDGEGNPATWPFDEAHYLIINFAFGGTWGGTKGVDLDALPLTYEIDYVRYFKLSE